LIAADTSTWIAFFQDDHGGDTDALARALGEKQVLMAPVVLTELLSDPKLPPAIAQLLMGVPSIDLTPGYWERAGRLRAKALAKGREARLGDTLIAQSCLDRGIRLITRDRDFRAFAEIVAARLLA
jgi:predicted nucleic acid-binding protein